MVALAISPLARRRLDGVADQLRGVRIDPIKERASGDSQLSAGPLLTVRRASWPLTGLWSRDPVLLVKIRTTRHHVESSCGCPIDMDS